jgi:ATP-dependent DNA ligase I
MKFTEFRTRHDAIRGEAKNLPRETLIKELLDACSSTEELVAVCQLLLGNVGTPVESLTTGIKETWLGNHFDIETRSLNDVEFHLASAWLQQSRLNMHDSTVLQFRERVRAHASSSDRSNAAKTRLVEYAIGLPSAKDAFLALEILCGKVSNKLDATTIFYALARRRADCPFDGSWKAADKKRLKRAFMLKPDLSLWATAWEGRTFWEPIDATLPVIGEAVAPQLADPGKDLASIFDGRRLVYEPKIDGNRIHVHVHPDGRVQLFTRQLKEVTEDHPEIVRQVSAHEPLRSSIIDGELVAMGLDNEILPFELVGRKDSNLVAHKAIVVYDALIVSGRHLLNVPLHERRAAFAPAIDGVRCLSLNPQTQLVDLAQLEAVVEACHADGLEGVVVKDLDSTIQPGERDPAFVKAKADYRGDLADSVDAVVVGYNVGRGKRHGLVGSLWIAVRDGETFHPVSKVGTGFSEKDLEDWTQRLIPNRLDGIPSSVTAGRIGGDVEFWVEPQHVIEVHAAEVSRSPHYSAGADADGRGLSLRFPRRIRDRTDKAASEATSVADLLAMARRGA